MAEHGRHPEKTLLYIEYWVLGKRGEILRLDPAILICLRKYESEWIDDTHDMLKRDYDSRIEETEANIKRLEAMTPNNDVDLVKARAGLEELQGKIAKLDYDIDKRERNAWRRTKRQMRAEAAYSAAQTESSKMVESHDEAADEACLNQQDLPLR
ncbi:hypothetical protein KVT40_003180 [Elsinoe batatas]|uniref:Uncharacterized protein n=1 Tax=Elsinoe batatas TaxID=2601811 RepID=A0A8K0L5K7_9PEZI|nr:hypothetical protein KVT40_003180 [Elsinoe batatas]